jgi:hypothetical protein
LPDALKINHDGKTYQVELTEAGEVDRIVTSWANPVRGRPPLSRSIYQGGVGVTPSPRVKAILDKVELKSGGAGKGKPDAERYCVTGQIGGVEFAKPFRTKGLAFACARREAPSTVQKTVRVERQRAPAGSKDWTAVEAWRFHADGYVERVTESVAA